VKKWRFYIQEALEQLDFAKRCFADFKHAETSGDVIDLFFHLHHFIVHVANVDKLLNSKPGSERALLLTGHVDLSGIDFKPFRRRRNHLEHFDERLDTWLSNYDGHAFFDKNIITGTKGFPPKAFLRALDGDVFTFYGEDYPLGQLREAVEQLHSRLSAVDAKAG